MNNLNDKSFLDLLGETVENVRSEVCDKLCKFRDTADDDFICDYIRKNGYCPMDRL